MLSLLFPYQTELKITDTEDREGKSRAQFAASGRHETKPLLTVEHQTSYLNPNKSRKSDFNLFNSTLYNVSAYIHTQQHILKQYNAILLTGSIMYRLLKDLGLH